MFLTFLSLFGSTYVVQLLPASTLHCPFLLQATYPQQASSAGAVQWEGSAGEVNQEMTFDLPAPTLQAANCNARHTICYLTVLLCSIGQLKP